MTYPNTMTFPLMDNCGMPPPVQGMLVVTLRHAHKLPSGMVSTIDPYVEMEVRKGRRLVSSTKMNNASPDWVDETYRFVVDDMEHQVCVWRGGGGLVGVGWWVHWGSVTEEIKHCSGMVILIQYILQHQFNVPFPPFNIPTTQKLTVLLKDDDVFFDRCIAYQVLSFFSWMCWGC